MSAATIPCPHPAWCGAQFHLPGSLALKRCLAFRDRLLPDAPLPRATSVALAATADFPRLPRGFRPLDNPATMHVDADDVPTVAWPRIDHHAVSEEDSPGGLARYFATRAGREGEPLPTFTLCEVDVAELRADGPRCIGGVHQAACYDPANTDNACGDNMSDGDFDDGAYVRKMATQIESMPALVMGENGAWWGGGHRTAAMREAGLRTYPVWVDDRLLQRGEDLSRPTVVEQAVAAVRRHDAFHAERGDLTAESSARSLAHSTTGLSETQRAEVRARLAATA